MGICELPSVPYAFVRRIDLTEIGSEVRTSHAQLVSILGESLEEEYPRGIMGQIDDEIQDSESDTWDMGLLLRNKEGAILIGARSAGFMYPDSDQLEVLRPETQRVLSLNYPEERFEIASGTDWRKWIEIRRKLIGY